MSDLSQPGGAAPAAPGMWATISKVAGRLLDGFVVQPVAIKLTVLVLAVLISASPTT